MDQIVRFYELGGPDVLRLEEAAPEQPRPGEVLIGIKAFGLNNSEAQLRRGVYPMMDADFPSRIGREAVGEVLATGEGVTAFSKGDQVCTIPAFDVKRSGVYGSWCVVPEAGVVRRPAGLSDVEACAIWQQFLTAYGPVVLYGHVGPGDTVLITAAASSVGLGAVQLAKAEGAMVIGTTRTDAKADIIRAAGADHVIVTSQESLTEQVSRLTNGKGFSICLDPVAGPWIADLVEAAAPGGRIYLYGQLVAEPAPLPLVELMRKGVAIQGYTLWEITLNPELREQVTAEISRRIESKALKPMIDRTFDLADIREAHRYLDTGAQSGKIVVTVGDTSV